MTTSLEGWPTKAKEAPSPHEARLVPLDTNPVFQSIGVIQKFSLTTNNSLSPSLEMCRYQFVNDNEFGMFVEIISLLLSIFEGYKGVNFLCVFSMVHYS